MRTTRVGTRYAKVISAYRASHQSGDAQSQNGEKIMKRTRQLTLIAFTTLFIISVAVLWASAPAKVSAQTRARFPFAAPRGLTGLASQGSPSAFVQGLFEAPWRGFDT